MNRVDKTASYIYSLKIIAPTHFVTRDQKVSFNQIEYKG